MKNTFSPVVWFFASLYLIFSCVYYVSPFLGTVLVFVFAIQSKVFPQPFKLGFGFGCASGHGCAILLTFFPTFYSLSGFHSLFLLVILFGTMTFISLFFFLKIANEP